MACGFAVLAMTVLACGCSPLSAVHWGVKLVGNAVDHVEVKEGEQKLIGRRPSAADEMFGKRTNTLRDVNSDREWLVYPVKLDVLNEYHYVVEVTGNRIVALSKTQKNATPELDIPETLVFKKKAVGRSPAECEAHLGIGKPLLTARSEETGRLSQLYDAQLIKIKGVLKPHHLILRFDAQQKCDKVELVSVVASSKETSLDL